MPHNRAPKKGAKYYLPKYEYKTVVAFCFQYPELKRKLRDIDGFHAVVNDGMPHASGASNPTESDAIKRAEIQNKIDLIENVTKEQTGILYKWMIQGITDETMTYTRLRNQGIPVGKNLYSEMRRRVYYHIAQRL